MRNTLHEISGCHTINLKHGALQISFRINCSNKVFSFSPCVVGFQELRFSSHGHFGCRPWGKTGGPEAAWLSALGVACPLPICHQHGCCALTMTLEEVRRMWRMFSSGVGGIGLG